jgi:catalase
MTHDFVRYSPDLERIDPNFEDSLRTVLETMRRYIAASTRAPGTGRAVRDAHAKGYGLARAEVEILDSAPAAYAQGIYAEPGRHEALVRFSNGNAHVGPDMRLGNVVGIGLKILGVDGPTLLEDEQDSGTFDYALINHPVFFVNTVEHYRHIQELLFQRGAPPPADDTREQARARFRQLLYDFLTGMDSLPRDEWAWDELGAFLSARSIEAKNLLLSTYWTMGAMRHGDYVAKVRVTPVQEFAEQVVRRTLDPASAAEVFRPTLVAELREHPYEFDLQVQLCTDLLRTPVENVTVEWPERISPFVTVAKLRLPRQDIGGDENLVLQDATSITPWRCTAEHRPLGNIQRARKEVYRQSSLLRHDLNHQVRREPRNLAEVFAVSGRL